MERSMRATLTRKSQAVVTPRALERQALHEFDDGRLVLEHLSGDPQAFGTLVDRYQTRLLNFINPTIGDPGRLASSVGGREKPTLRPRISRGDAGARGKAAPTGPGTASPTSSARSGSGAAPRGGAPPTPLGGGGGGGGGGGNLVPDRR